MNFVFDSIEELKIENLSFLDAKKNNIIEGNFTKIIYNDEFITLNGIFIYVSTNVLEANRRIDDDDDVCCTTERELFFNLEYEMLILYKKVFDIEKNLNLSLRKQLLNNSFKIYKGTFIKNNKKQIYSSEKETRKTSIVLKISGIWENECEIGITFKFFEMAEI